jgi:nicotinate-nucleotide pyrophosphorylase (carboxylating)
MIGYAKAGEDAIVKFLEEDIQSGDITSESIFTDLSETTGVFVAKDEGIIAGVDLISTTYDLLGSAKGYNTRAVTVTLSAIDGDKVTIGQTIAEVSGPTILLLEAERVILNLMQRMSGIATLTDAAVTRLNDPKISILDTRKTAPGLRVFDKAAVRIGGGQNHRFGLYDMVMIKDNHIDFAGSISKAVQNVRAHVQNSITQNNVAQNGIKIEVEARNLRDVEEAVNANVDVIMLDNFELGNVSKALELVPEHIKTEVSGGVTFETLPQYKGSGVDFISLGYLTHSAKAFDISFISEDASKDRK